MRTVGYLFSMATVSSRTADEPGASPAVVRAAVTVVEPVGGLRLLAALVLVVQQAVAVGVGRLRGRRRRLLGHRLDPVARVGRIGAGGRRLARWRRRRGRRAEGLPQSEE